MTMRHQWKMFHDGRMTLQAYVHEYAGVDEDGVAHLTGRGEWVDVLTIHGDGELEPHGDKVGEDHACKHGVKDGDWCEPCNREYKLARELQP